MAIVQICDFGEKDGIKMYRVHGEKIDLEKILQACHDEDAKFDEAYWNMLEKASGRSY